MTITVNVKNTDTRNTAIISVQQFNNTSNTFYSFKKELKGGEEYSAYVCYDTDVIVKEVSQ